jgi:hypothetical protein
METNLQHPVVDFNSVTDLMRQGDYSENSSWYTSAVRVEKTVLSYVRCRKNEMFGIVSKILNSSPKDPDIAN